MDVSCQLHACHYPFFSSSLSIDICKILFIFQLNFKLLELISPKN